MTKRGFDPRKVPTQKVILDRSHPLANKLISALVPGLAGMKDLSGYGNSPVLSGGSHSNPYPPIVPTTIGNALHVLNDAWIWSIPTTPTVSGDFTLYWINFENSNESPIFGTQFSSRQPVDNSFDIGFYATGGLHGDVGDGTNWVNTNVNGSSSLVFDNVPTHYAVTIQSGVAGWVYCQGQAGGGAGLGAGTCLLWDSTHILQMGSDSTYGLHGSIPFIGIWNRALTAGEIAQMYAEPFAMFRPVVRKQYYAQSSGPAPTTGIVQANAKKPVANVTARVGELATVSANAKKPVANMAATAAAPNETGTITCTTKKPTASVSGTVGERATISTTTKKPVANVSGTSAVPNETGTIQANIKKPIAVLASAVGEQATIAATVKKPLANVSANAAIPNETGSISSTVRKPVAAISAASALPGTSATVATTTKKPVATVSGRVNETGAVQANARKPVASFVATVGEKLTISPTLKKPIANISGNTTVINATGTIQASVKKPVSTLTAYTPVQGTTAIIGGSYSRASVATYFDASGTLQTAGVDVPRDTHSTVSPYTDLGWLIEPASTNYIRNPRGEGAVAGTPGSIPTQGWSFTSAGGVARQVVGSGTINGVPYVDVRMFGTVTTAAQLYINHTFDTAIPCTVGQTFTASVWLQLIADVGTTNVPSYTFTFPQSPSTTYLSTASMTSASLATWQRRSVTAVSTNSSMTAIAFSLWSGGASSILNRVIDITLRMGLPQFEFASTASSHILPPIGAPAVSTRAADIGYPNQAVLKKPVASVSGFVANEVITITSTIRKPASNMAGVSNPPNETATVAATVKKPTSSLVARWTNQAAIISSIKKPVASFSVTMHPVGSISSSVRKPTATMIGVVPFDSAPSERTWYVKPEDRYHNVAVEDRYVEVK